MPENKKSNILDLLHKPDKDTPFVPIESFCGLFPLGEVSMITAQAGVGKSWLIRHCMQNASIGLDVFGNECKDDYASICFSGELSEKALQLRDRLTRNLDYDPDRTKYITVEALASNGHIPTLAGDEDGARFKALVQTAVTETKAKAVFFDSLVSFNTGDENSTKDMSTLFNWASTFAKSNNIAVVFSHHLRKQGKEKLRTIDDVAGNSAMIRLCQTVYLMEAIKTGPLMAVALGGKKQKGYLTNLLVRQIRNASLVRDPFIFTIETREEDTGEISTEITEQSCTVFNVRDDEGVEITPDEKEKETLSEAVHDALMELLNEKSKALSSEVKTFIQETRNIKAAPRTIMRVIKDMLANQEIIRLEQKQGHDYVYCLPATATATAKGGYDELSDELSLEEKIRARKDREKDEKCRKEGVENWEKHFRETREQSDS